MVYVIKRYMCRVALFYVAGIIMSIVAPAAAADVDMRRTELRIRVLAYMRHNHINQKQMAERAGCSRSTVSKFINGKTRFSQVLKDGLDRLENGGGGDNATPTAAAPLCTRERKGRPGWLYIFHNSDDPHVIKVGRAMDVDRRLRDARTFAPKMAELYRVYAQEDAASSEKQAHAMLARYRVRYDNGGYEGGAREWFSAPIHVAYAIVLKACLPSLVSSYIVVAPLAPTSTSMPISTPNPHRRWTASNCDQSRAVARIDGVTSRAMTTCTRSTRPLSVSSSG